jgi:hypothetical protein
MIALKGRDYSPEFAGKYMAEEVSAICCCGELDTTSYVVLSITAAFGPNTVWVTDIGRPGSGL